MHANIPPNVTGAGKVLGGLFSFRNAVEAIAVIAAFFYGPKLLLFFLPSYIQLAVTAIFGIPLALLCLVGIKGLSLTEWLTDYFEFKKYRRLYPLKIPTPPDEPKEKKSGRKEKSREK